MQKSYLILIAITAMLLLASCSHTIGCPAQNGDGKFLEKQYSQQLKKQKH